MVTAARSPLHESTAPYLYGSRGAGGGEAKNSPSSMPTPQICELRSKRGIGKQSPRPDKGGAPIGLGRYDGRNLAAVAACADIDSRCLCLHQEANDVHWAHHYTDVSTLDLH
jgi:hypothetical protein